MASSSKGKDVEIELKEEQNVMPEYWFDAELVYSPDSLCYEERCAKLLIGPTKKEIVSPLAPDMFTMQEFGFFDKVSSIFNEVGLPYWSSLMSSPTYDKLVVEFIATFSREAGEDFSCDSWRYAINNIWIVTKAKSIREYLFGSKDVIGEVPQCTEEERTFVWNRLTDMEVYSPNWSPRCIKKGKRIYIHQLIASHFNPRTDGASRVTREDLDIMYYM